MQSRQLPGNRGEAPPRPYPAETSPGRDAGASPRCLRCPTAQPIAGSRVCCCSCRCWSDQRQCFNWELAQPTHLSWGPSQHLIPPFGQSSSAAGPFPFDGGLRWQVKTSECLFAHVFIWLEVVAIDLQPSLQAYNILHVLQSLRKN